MEIVLIKLGADGDVLRTLPLAQAIKKKYPQAKLTWITKGDIATLLEGISYIDKVVQIGTVLKKKIDILYNFDLEADALTLASSIDADSKFGFYLEGTYPAAFNSGAEYYLNTSFDDELKKKNKKTYQEMMFLVAELPSQTDLCEITLTKKDKEYAQTFAKTHRLTSKKVIGIHLGASARWPSKQWHEDNLKTFIQLAARKNYEILLFGGPSEAEKLSRISEELKQKGVHVHRNNPTNTKREFAALVNLCNVVVCADSFALHVALALRKRTIALFFCTSPREVEDYGLLTKLVSSQLEGFFPSRMNEYNELLVKSISAERVLQEVEKVI